MAVYHPGEVSSRMQFVWNKPLQWFLAQLFINILPESLKTNNFARHAVNKKE
jgi:hypothetical protein